FNNIFGCKMRGTDHRPAAARMSAAGFAEIAVAIVGADAIEGRGLERDETDGVGDVPDALDADARAVPLMVHDRMPVIDLEETVCDGVGNVLGRDRIAKIRMIEMGQNFAPRFG